MIYEMQDQFLGQANKALNKQSPSDKDSRYQQQFLIIKQKFQGIFQRYNTQYHTSCQSNILAQYHHLNAPYCLNTLLIGSFRIYLTLIYFQIVFDESRQPLGWEEGDYAPVFSGNYWFLKQALQSCSLIIYPKISWLKTPVIFKRKGTFVDSTKSTSLRCKGSLQVFQYKTSLPFVNGPQYLVNKGQTIHLWNHQLGAQLSIFLQIWVIWPRNAGWMFQIVNTASHAYIDQQSQKMIFLESTDQERYDNLPYQFSHKRDEESLQLSFIQQYFDANVFEKKLLSQQSSQEKSVNSATQPQRKDSGQTGNHETEPIPSKKSIFHNFQKHLITLLRKIIELSFSSTNQNSNEQLGVLLWNAFKKMSSYNKQTFHMIFGVSNFDHFEAQLQKVASKYKQFRPLWNRYSSDQIFEAQTFIRKQVVQQMSRINKNGIRACCNVHNFQTFYQYLSSFLNELKEGPITSRMSKTRKLVVMAKISNNSLNK